MAWLAAAVDWQGADRSDSIPALLRPEPWHVRVSEGRNRFASWGLASGSPDPADEGPLEHEGLVVLFDGRLDNGRELAEALGCASVLAVELVARGYLRWGADVSSRLLGDLAVIIVDAKERRVVVFRDPSGVRPLAYHADARGLTIATDPLQLLRLSQISRTPDDDTIIEHLLRRGTSLERTFFRAIKRVPPGHRLMASDGSLSIESFLQIPPEDPRLDAPEIVLEELRSRLFDSVRDRARGPQPVAAYLSGGIDSSVIVCAADTLARDGQIDPLSCTLSARYPGRPNDEGPFIAAVSQQTAIRAVEWDATQSIVGTPIAMPAPPFLTEPPGNQTLEWSAVVDSGARVVLDGLGGDEVGAFPGVMEDLGRRRRWMTALSRIGEPGIDRHLRARRAWAFLKGSVAADLPRIHEGSRAIRARLRRPARWLSPRGRELAHASMARGWTGGGPFASAAQAWTWARVSTPFFVDTLERLHRRGVFMGVDRRYPFLDRRVVDLILQIPVSYRLNHPYRRLHQSAMSGRLPALIADRQTKANFDASLVARIRVQSSIIEQTLRRGPWLCAPWVDRERALSAAVKVLTGSDSPPPRAFEAVSKITALELWLRQLG